MRSSVNHFLSAATLFVAMGSPAICDAATATASFQVRITIQTACTINAIDLDFGTHGVLSANVDQTSTINVQCTNATPYNIGLGPGDNGSSVTTRQMGMGAARIDYSLFRDAARSLNWGDTVGTDTLGGTGNGAVQPTIVYGRVPAQTTPAPGTYTDTVTATVTY
jgi:spore coat protein U-like protein